MSSGAIPQPLVSVRGLTKDFGGRRIKVRRAATDHLRAVDEVDLAIAPGEAVGIVGESGSGKTTVARCLLRLVKPTAGDIHFDGKPVLSLSGTELRAFRSQAQIVFQDPWASLDPRFTVLRALAEPLRVHGVCRRSEIPGRAAELLQRVGLSDDFSSRYRHELSGGEAQRVAIARALATSPRFLVLDEPTSALDASARLKVITLLSELRRDLGISYLVISHDLSSIRYLCERVLVMYLGRVIEQAPADELFANPQHPYTKALLSATPVLRGDAQTARIRLRDAIEAPPPGVGCVLAPRCPYAIAECSSRPQRLEQIAPGRAIACHRVSEGQIVLAPPTHMTHIQQAGGELA
jgi:oligopeptide/dipeptide ABC transporter ATP-binding protein